MVPILFSRTLMCQAYMRGGQYFNMQVGGWVGRWVGGYDTIWYTVKHIGYHYYLVVLIVVASYIYMHGTYQEALRRVHVCIHEVGGLVWCLMTVTFPTRTGFYPSGPQLREGIANQNQRQTPKTAYVSILPSIPLLLLRNHIRLWLLCMFPRKNKRALSTLLSSFVPSTKTNTWYTTIEWKIERSKSGVLWRDTLNIFTDKRRVWVGGMVHIVSR